MWSKLCGGFVSFCNEASFVGLSGLSGLSTFVALSRGFSPGWSRFCWSGRGVTWGMVGGGGMIVAFPVGAGVVDGLAGLMGGALGMFCGCLLVEGLPCSSHSPSSSFWPITIALLGGVALGGTSI